MNRPPSISPFDDKFLTEQFETMQTQPAEMALGAMNSISDASTQATSTFVNTFNQDFDVPFVDNYPPDWLQQMNSLEPLQWGGGEHHYEG